MDYICDYINFVVVGIYWRLYGGWAHSCPAGHCRHRVSGPTYSGTKRIVAIWTLAGEGESFGKEVVSRSGEILQNPTIPFVENEIKGQILIGASMRYTMRNKKC